MRADTLRSYKSVHTWTGIVAGMALFIAFYAGALTIFKQPLLRWLTPPDAARAGAVALDALPALVRDTLQARPAAAREFQLELAPAGQAGARLSWREMPPGVAEPEHGDGNATHYIAYRDGDGLLRIETTEVSGLPGFIDTLHRVVGLPEDNDPSRWLMGVVAALYAVALVSGLILLLPTLVRDFFALRVGKNLKRMWLDAHNVVGITSLPFHLVMALTALIFAFHDQLYTLQDVLVHEGRLQAIWRGGPAPAGPRRAPVARDPAAMLPPARLLAQARTMAPGFEPQLMQYTQVSGPRASVRIWGFDARDIARAGRGGFVALDPYSGRVLNDDLLPGHQSPLSATITSFFTLHFGNFGGTPVRWMYFALGLAGAFLFYTGNLLWVESRRRAERRDRPAPVQTRSTRWMAAATVGVCLGCVCGLSLSIAAGKWLHGAVADLDAWHRGLYYALFFAALGWAFWRGAARAAVELLWLATACTAAIPLATLAAWLRPDLGLWVQGSGPTLAVDAVALAGVLAWAWMARLTARRVRQGRSDSVWSAAATPAAPPLPQTDGGNALS